MSVTLNIKADVAGTLVWEDRRFRELSETSNRTTSTFYDETSDTSSIQYTGNDGQQGFLDKVYATLQSSKNPLIASDWNTFQSESKTSFDALETATYSSVSATGLRDLVLSGNKNGAFTQTVSGESADNAMAEYGIFKDSDGDGTADGVSIDLGQNSIVLTDSALYGNSQYSESDGTSTLSPRVAHTFNSTGGLSIGDLIYYVGYIKIDDTTNVTDVEIVLRATLLATTLSTADVISIDSSYEEWVKISGVLNITSATSLNQIVIRTTLVLDSTVSGRPLQTSNFTCINLTKKYGIGNEPSEAQAKLNFPTPFINIAHATINSKITGTNGEFELKEPFVLPKDPAGTASEIVTLDGQNFIRMKHKLFVLNGNSNWSDFTDATLNYRVGIDNFNTDNLLLESTLDSGVGFNTDGKIPVISTAYDFKRFSLFSDGRLLLYIDKALINAMPSGGTLAGLKEYLNANPIHCFFRIDLSANYIDIPIKHLASIEGGTFINNSTILPSAITLTYPTNEAGERESTQIAQNQITTTKSNIKEETSTIYQNGLPVYEQPIFSQTQVTVYQGGLPVLEFDNTTSITTEYTSGLPTKETEVEL